MGQEDHGNWVPIGAPLYNDRQRDEHWRHFDNSVNAVSFGFVATAILISMFLVMAIFERFLRPTPPDFSPSGGRSRRDIESQMMSYNPKLAQPLPKVSSNPFFSVTKTQCMLSDFSDYTLFSFYSNNFSILNSLQFFSSYICVWLCLFNIFLVIWN